VDAQVRSVLSRSHLRDLPGDVLDELVAGAGRVRIATGSVLHREGDDAPHLDLVVAGVVRFFVTAPDGRTMTIRYCRPGAIIGAASLFAAGFVMPATTQALVDAELLRMSPTTARRAAARDVRVAQALLSELSERVLSFVWAIPGSALATVRQRVARHLLDLASERVPEPPSEHRSVPELVVTVSQRELAAAAGTAREVVVQVLRELRQDGVIRTGRDQIVIADAARLIQESGWNQSPLTRAAPPATLPP
jgi:CRP/FNR family cyclic AMP-dependent transcriptional regulator